MTKHHHQDNMMEDSIGDSLGIEEDHPVEVVRDHHMDITTTQTTTTTIITTSHTTVHTLVPRIT